MQEIETEAVFKPTIAERMAQTDATFRAIASQEYLERQEKTRRLKLARLSLSSTEN